MKKFRFLLLTKSYKDSGYCVAGINLDENKFVRLVASTDLEFAFIPRTYIDTFPAIEYLDILEIEPIKAVPFGCQTENILVDINSRPAKIGRANLTEIFRFVSSEQKILGNAKRILHSSQVERLKYSLGLYIVDNLKIICYFDEDNNKYINQCEFLYKDILYTQVALTDPIYRNVKNNEKVLSKAAIVVSLPPLPFKDGDFYYKFVAKIFDLTNY